MSSKIIEPGSEETYKIQEIIKIQVQIGYELNQTNANIATYTYLYLFDVSLINSFICVEMAGIACQVLTELLIIPLMFPVLTCIKNILPFKLSCNSLPLRVHSFDWYGKIPSSENGAVSDIVY